MQSTPPFSCPPAGATRASARGVTAEWGGCNGMLGVWPVRSERMGYRTF